MNATAPSAEVSPNHSATIPPLRFLEDDLHQVDAALENIIGSASQFLASYKITTPALSGKKVRPGLVLLAAQVCGQMSPAIYAAAAAIESIHWASLLHDDVIDETSLRRGKATLNSVAGNKFTILLGDYLLTQATKTICELNEHHLILALSQAAGEMSLGQMLELQHQGDINTTAEEYLEIISGKTAALMEVSCHFGAILAKATPRHCEILTRYGRNIGIAFQITDDILDFWGNPLSLGKPTFSDMAEGKYTLPLLLARQLASPAQKHTLDSLLASPSLSPADCSAILDILNQLDARHHSQIIANRYLEQALADLEELPARPARQALAGLPRFLVERSF